MAIRKSLSLEERYAHVGMKKIPVDTIISDDYFRDERDSIFKRQWLCIGRIEDVPEQGYIVKNYEALQASVILTRDADQRIRAFHNMCPHRGMIVCQPGKHEGRRMNCPYHGWAFDLGGRVAGVPGEHLFHDFDKSSFSLAPIAVDTWEGFIFINLSPKPEETLKEFLGEIYDLYGGYFTQGMTKRTEYGGTLDMNWKLYMDSSIEAYHANVVHLFNATGQVAKATPELLMVDPDTIHLYKRHRSIGVPMLIGERQMTPAENVAFKFSAAAAAYNAGGAVQKLAPGINCTNDPNWAFDILEIFPNTVIFISAGLYMFLQTWPVSAGKSTFVGETYMHPARTAAEWASQEYAIVSIREIVREDLNTAIGQTAIAPSRAIPYFTCNEQEIAVRHNYFVVDQHVQAWRDRKTDAVRPEALAGAR